MQKNGKFLFKSSDTDGIPQVLNDDVLLTIELNTQLCEMYSAIENKSIVKGTKALWETASQKDQVGRIETCTQGNSLDILLHSHQYLILELQPMPRL